MLNTNTGVTVHNDYAFFADGIHSFNPVTNGANIFSCSRVKSLFELDTNF